MQVATSKVKSMNTRVAIYMSGIIGFKIKFKNKVFLLFPDCFEGHCDRFFFSTSRWALPSFYADEQLASGMVGHDLFGSGG